MGDAGPHSDSSNSARTRERPVAGPAGESSERAPAGKAGRPEEVGSEAGAGLDW